MKYHTITLAMTGASGAPYGLRLLEQLIAARCKIYLLVSKAAQTVIAQETRFKMPSSIVDQQRWVCETFSTTKDQVEIFDREDWFSPVASGSGVADAMVVCPASGGTLSALANGASNNLIERAGDVALKERKKLILIPRETPYNQVHLENMLKLTKMGAVILPGSPGFYQKPRSVDDLVDFVVSRILDQLELPQALLPKWGGNTSSN